RGVFYTPDPLVAFIVNSVDSLLKTEFHFPRGLLEPEFPIRTLENGLQGEQNENSHELSQIFAIINLLDPATGTGTFLRHAIRLVKRNFEAEHPDRNSSELQAEWGDYVYHNLLDRFTGCELLLAPFVVANLLIGNELRKTGFEFPQGGRIGLYLTNTLEQGLSCQSFGNAGISPARPEQKTFPIIIGNPPFARGSSNKSKDIENLLATYKAPVLGERNLQALSDDYLKFLRLAQAFIEQAGWGLIGFVLNNRFLTGRVHRGVRKVLTEYFDQIYILDLHGGKKGYEHTPPNLRDENLFDISQGICIGLFVKFPPKWGTGNGTHHCYFYEIYGLKQQKFGFLVEHEVSSVPWESLYARSPGDPFVPDRISPQIQAEWDSFRSLTAIFPYYSVGGKPGDDNLLVSFQPEEVLPKLQAFMETIGNGGTVGKLTEAKRKIRAHLETLVLNPARVEPYLYRPFDVRWVYYDSSLWTRGVPAIKKECRGNILFLCAKIVNDAQWAHVFVARIFPDVIALSNSSSENCYVFPLQILRKGASSWNLTAEYIAYLEEMGIKLNPEDEINAITYVYAMLSSAAYRKRYQSLLCIGDFPRVPLVQNPEFFTNMCELGRELIRLHFNPADAKVWVDISHNIQDGDQVAPKYPQFDGRRILIAPEKGFYPVTQAMWDYKVGKYQVCRTWGNSRVGRPLTSTEIQNYLSTLQIISQSIILVEKIDNAIANYGGFPLRI
ncbi:MAG TPA: type ISP restriction/modification enzyme, partial [Candidatus Lokiarchaeia archaeon]|nr:type ISP restriction/modification enzyme [Candidatus Lokiarchaeia archaeon]